MGLTPKQFRELENRVSGRRGSKPREDLILTGSEVAAGCVILGIDPSLRGTGYGFIRTGKPNSTAIDHGTIVCPARWQRSRCLVQIAATLRDLIKKHHPELCVVEGLFFAQNLKTAITMGEARGAGLVAAAEAGMPIYEIAPRKVKQAIVGYGAASKNAVAKMVQRMLQLDEVPASDAADALALALTYAGSGNLLVGGAVKPI
ncbi:MAG TPA: crossover junction endodeoxyribonuclease RuvC [Verrucomicrobiales bacterium]|nr:crossover junction endodeoxyribonuclease RuvC [Verrucomicrobiales bacterium]